MINNILTISEPNLNNLKVSAIKIKAREDNVEGDNSNTVGLEAPLIKVNNSTLNKSSLSNFILNNNSFSPSISFTFNDIDGDFERDFPKDGDLIELYIRSTNDEKYKKIRLNFNILNIKGIDGKNGKIYNIKGILNVPKLYSEISFNYIKNSSFNHLIEVANYLNIGFASNISNTDDEMIRFNPSNTIQDFISKTTNTSYLNDNSFFMSFIDLYYYLNMVEVNSTFVVNHDLEVGDLDMGMHSTKDSAKESEGIENTIIFTNDSKYQNTNNYINNYSMYNNSGSISFENGYKRYVQYFDVDEKTSKEFFIDPLTTKGSENTHVILKGKVGDNSYENENKYKYLGRFYSTDNYLHNNYHFAKIHNYQNNKEIDKMGIIIELNGVSNHIQRYSTIPIAIYKSSTYDKTRLDRSEEDKGEEVNKDFQPHEKVIDSFLSGWYVVHSYSIKWNKGNYKQVVKLVRREWSEPHLGGNISD